MAIRVLIVDDSAFVRRLLTDIMSLDKEIEVVGAAPNPIIARDMIKSLDPDVLTLDVEMPRMDGLAFLEKIMTLRPMPVVMISSLTQKGTEIAIKALEMGAVDVIAKPVAGLADGFASLMDEIVFKVKAAAKARVKAPKADPTERIVSSGSFRTSERIVAIGASTGGVEAAQRILTALPADSPAVVLTQHMPAAFTASFAARLNGCCAVTVCQAEQGQRVLPGHVYIAPGGLHLELARDGTNYVCSVYDGPLVGGHKPSVDVLFGSVARSAGASAVGIILTGMGKDGAAGLLAMRKAGAFTIGQDEATSIVYGMPKAAKDIGATDIELPLHKIASHLLSKCEQIVGRAARV